jgi:phenylalanyl-tRNA synthetase beta chain
MKVLLSWLKEYIDLNLSPAQIAKILTSGGIEVEAIQPYTPGFQKVVVGQVIAVQKHPDADKLCVASVSDGLETYQVVCGAPNCRSGIKTAFALVGATLTDETGKAFQVKPAKLRGVQSFGMLCSAKELGLSSDHDGIMEFAEHVKEGADVAEMYADAIFEISLTPNLGHCASTLGIARELSALIGIPYRIPTISLQEDASHPLSDQIEVTIQNGEQCPRYACRLIRNVTVGPSPDWLKKRIEACGLRSVNNVVDSTNFVLWELGHPIHAFDWDRIAGHHILVRQATDRQELLTIDGKNRVLSSSDLIISDLDKPLALAGLMGGQNSEVGPETRHVLIESAYFQPAAIRRMSKRLGLMTEASKHFERGADPNAVLPALNRAAMLIQQVAGGEISAGILDLCLRDFSPLHLNCRLDKLNQLLGTHLSASEVESIFQRLGFGCQWNGQNGFAITVPTYRVDIQSEIDLVEEVARIYGYDNIPRAPAYYQTATLPEAPIFLFEREVRQRLLNEGLQEFLTCDLIGPTIQNIVKSQVIPEESMVHVLNPTSIEQSILRASLLPGLLQVVKHNMDHQIHHINGFEIGRVHFKQNDHYKEQSMAGIILSGKNRLPHWDQKPRDVDFYDLKGILENLFAMLHLPKISFKASQFDIFHSGRQASLYADALEIGWMGEIHPSVQRRLDVSQRILFAEFNLHDLYQIKPRERKMQELPLYPASERDWTVTLEEGVPIEKVLDTLKSAASPLVEEISLSDLFRSEKIGPHKKNATFHFVYRDLHKTLEQQEVDREHTRLMSEAMKFLM